MKEIIQFEPLYQERIWGGCALEEFAGRTLPGARRIGESWELVDRPEAQSVVRDGPYAGRTLHALLTEQAAEIMGPGWPAPRAFPLLVKWLDCRERLSLQVHPPEPAAGLLGGEPKTENWYIAAAAPGAAVFVGLEPGVTRDQFERAIASRTLEACLRRIPVVAGDSILVHSGTVHTIDAGCLILEIQQNSDTTYRVYDWGRVGLDGRPRKLHVRESLASIQFYGAVDSPLVPAADTPAVLADSKEFRLRRVPLATGAEFRVAGRQQPRILSVVAGRVRTGSRILRRGDNALLPYAGSFAFAALEKSVVLVTEHFAVLGS
ncbi:MAG: class I mannose-6-phosphate isomerase [Opitutaceae bacterium]|nr:class I mannose-6-phosphate isomerase [Opitutaceae bacterium]